jgi:hypothetical protein
MLIHDILLQHLQQIRPRNAQDPIFCFADVLPYLKHKKAKHKQANGL